MQEVLARWLASLMLALLISTLDHRDYGSKFIVVIVRTVLISILLDALRLAF